MMVTRMLPDVMFASAGDIFYLVMAIVALFVLEIAIDMLF